MAKQKTEKLEFSKFFPKSTSFVVVSGSAESSDKFDLCVEIGDGSDKATFYLSEWFGMSDTKDGLASLKAIQEGVQKAIDFYTKATKLPKEEKDDRKIKPVKRVLKSTETVVKAKK